MANVLYRTHIFSCTNSSKQQESFEPHPEDICAAEQQLALACGLFTKE